MWPPISYSQVSGARLVVVDFPDDIEKTAEVGADGTATIQTDPVDSGYIWRVERYTTFISATQGGTYVTAPAGAQLAVYKGDSQLPIKFRDGSQSPSLDVSDNASPVTVQQGLQLTFAWSGLTPGTFANMSLQYALLARRIGP